MMDEPSSGLSPLFVKEVIRLLGSFRTEGLSLLIAEQNVKFLDLADRVYTLEGGRIGYAGSVAAMLENNASAQSVFRLVVNYSSGIRDLTRRVLF
jgi:branched-chain amino acid transport system ATP-binding protein